MEIAHDRLPDAGDLLRRNEQQPSGPLNIDPGLGGSPLGDVEAGAEEEFIDGFSWRTVWGALFIGLIMMPGAIYMGLVAGQGMGPAAEWVTIILFMEVARRSYQTLRKQEIYLLYYIGSSLTQLVGAGVVLTGGAFAPVILNQFMLNTPLARGVFKSGEIPNWVMPARGSQALLERTFIHHDWVPAIVLLLIFQILIRLNIWSLGYVMFRITSDIEQLPFPMAPITAQGAMALAESSAQKEGWRWRIFSIGAMIGVGWGAIYILVPTITGIIFSAPIVIVTNPYIDWSSNTKNILPAALTGLATDLGGVLIGFVLPLPIVVGTFISSIGAHVIASPILKHVGILKTWTAGLDITQGYIANWFDFWLSFIIGSTIVVAVVGIGSVIRTVMKYKREAPKSGAVRAFAPPKGRGDIPIPLSLAVWSVATVGFIGLCHYLVPGFPVWLLFAYGFVWTPLFSYINSRMAGMAGQSVPIPFVREASFMMSGYRNLDIWFAPIPLNDVSWLASQFRIVELTRTKFTSILKVELLMLPIALICSFFFWSFIWRLSPIPASAYPYAAKFWPIQAQTQIMWWTANRGEGNLLKQAINIHYILAGGIFATVSYLVIAASGLPILLFYGLINGIQVMPPFAIPGMIGGLLGRYYFQKRYGVENWRAYAPVLVAGYYCGMGLVGMGSVATVLLAKSVSRLPY